MLCVVIERQIAIAWPSVHWPREPPGLAVPCPVLLPQEIGAELVEARAADLRHHGVDLGAEDVDRLLYPRKPAGNGASIPEVLEFNRTMTPASAQTWRDLERYRRLFPRTLIVKGIMNPADAIRAAEIGADGVIVSNHGGRQLDQAPASLDALPAIKAAVGDRMTVMLDSGVRRGADILIALCLGAQFVFFGRPTLYGAVAGGLPGVKKAIDIFRGEIDLVMGQIGCPSLDQLGPDFLWRDDWSRNR
jgi:isopentenyl diphosphate isomerase/L-lactate dehydrogenase-like FMN-dependent dehydrogenase